MIPDEESKIEYFALEIEKKELEPKRKEEEEKASRGTLATLFGVHKYYPLKVHI